jgi:hypothetical protein
MRCHRTAKVTMTQTAKKPYQKAAVQREVVTPGGDLEPMALVLRCVEQGRVGQINVSGGTGVIAKYVATHRTAADAG